MKLYSDCHAAEVKVKTTEDGNLVSTILECSKCGKVPKKVFDDKKLAKED